MRVGHGASRRPGTWKACLSVHHLPPRGALPPGSSWSEGALGHRCAPARPKQRLDREGGRDLPSWPALSPPGPSGPHWPHKRPSRSSARRCLLCVLERHCPSLNLHSLSINWKPTLLRWVEGPVRQPRDVLARGLAWSAPCFSPALATHSFPGHLLCVSALGPHRLCAWGRLRVGWCGHCRAAAAGGGRELTLYWSQKATESQRKGVPRGQSPSALPQHLFTVKPLALKGRLLQPGEGRRAFQAAPRGS